MSGAVSVVFVYKSSLKKALDRVWNVMAHAQKPDFVFRRNGRVHLNRRGRQFSRLLAAEVCASAVVMLDTPCSEVVCRVLATHCIRQIPLHFATRAKPSRVYGADGAVRLPRHHPHHLRWGSQDHHHHPSKNSVQKITCCNSTSNAPDEGRMYPKHVELRIHQQNYFVAWSWHFVLLHMYVIVCTESATCFGHSWTIIKELQVITNGRV